MKTLLVLIAAIAITTTGSAQRPRQSPHDTVDSKDIKVTYGRPYKKGRVIFGELEKYGKVWRVGANEATQITFKKDGKFAGKDVKAGTYTLFAIPNEKEWTIILNSVLGQWGAYSYDKNKEKDVLQVNVPAKKMDKVIEQLTIRFPDKDEIMIEWDDTQIMIPVDF